MKILIVEDENYSARILQKILETEGYSVLMAKDGKEAWESYQENQERFVITDWNMPEMTGIQLCKNIREFNSPHYTYIIILTANNDISDISKAFDEGADDYLTKPIQPDELLSRVRAGERIIQLEENYKAMHSQLLQSEKMASVGQLAAGVAHEINNPTGFVSSNLSTLSEYQIDLGGIIEEYRSLISMLKESALQANLPSIVSDQINKIEDQESEIDIEFIMDDIKDLIGDCKDGTERIKKIVIDLKDFAHPGEDNKKTFDINKGIESTLNVVWNEIKYKAEVTNDFGDIPLIDGYPQQLNQVFMNIFVNAVQAIEERGKIHIVTRAVDGFVEIKISDTGSGIKEENLSKIFDPFFTTKEVGKGTGLGMNVAYNIVKKHNGTIDVESKVGEGTTFTIRIPQE